MSCLIVASTRPYAGKSGIIGALLLEARERGVDAAYFKPVGTVPVSAAGIETDSDAAYLSSLVGADVPFELVCPVVQTRAVIEAALSGHGEPVAPLVLDAFRQVAARAEAVFVEGPSDMTQGRALGLDLVSLTKLVSGRVLLIDRPGASGIPDETLRAHDALGDALLGVVLNDVAPDQLDSLAETYVAYLGSQGVRVLGALTHDAGLSSVTVGDIVTQLSGRVLAAPEALDRQVESFMVGAMGHDKALRYFQRRDHKAVVTGGDRADVQLAALETDTATIVCTGGTMPSANVLARAAEKQVPVIVVDMDTLSAVTRLEETFGRVRVHDGWKVGRIREMLRASVDLDAIFSALAAPTS